MFLFSIESFDFSMYNLYCYGICLTGSNHIIRHSQRFLSTNSENSIKERKTRNEASYSPLFLSYYSISTDTGPKWQNRIQTQIFNDERNLNAKRIRWTKPRIARAFFSLSQYIAIGAIMSNGYHKSYKASR